MRGKQIQNLFTHIATGSYVGTGTYGQNHPTVINCGFKPRYIIIWGKGANGLSIGQSRYQMMFGENMTNLGTGTIINLIPSVCSRIISVSPKISTTNDCVLINCDSQGDIFMFSTEKAVWYPVISSTYNFRISVVMTKILTDNGIKLVSEQYMIGEYGFQQLEYSSLETRTPASQMNENGVTYYYVALDQREPQ